MKKIEILVICCLSVFMLGACENGSISINSNSSSMSTLPVREDMNYQKACEELDFGKAHQILKKLRDVFVNEGLAKHYTKVNEKKGYNEYVDADIYIFREEVTYLMSLDDPAVENRIIKLIMETPLDGRYVEEGFEDYISELSDSDVWLYSYCLKRNNQKCDIVLDLSILNGNESLAKKVLLYYKDNMNIDNNKEIVRYCSTDKDVAQKRYNEAVKNGVFK